MHLHEFEMAIIDRFSRPRPRSPARLLPPAPAGLPVLRPCAHLRVHVVLRPLGRQRHCAHRAHVHVEPRIAAHLMFEGSNDRTYLFTCTVCQKDFTGQPLVLLYDRAFFCPCCSPYNRCEDGVSTCAKCILKTVANPDVVAHLARRLIAFVESDEDDDATKAAATTVGSQQPRTWRCTAPACGHEWTASPTTVLTYGTGCTDCTGTAGHGTGALWARRDLPVRDGDAGGDQRLVRAHRPPAVRPCDPHR